MNIKLKIYLLVFTLFAMGFFSCKKDNTITTPVLLEFVGQTATGQYAIKNDPKSVFKIPVGITKAYNKDITIQFTYSSSTATAGQQYNAPASMTIKAGEVVDSLDINGIFAGYPTVTKVDTLNITMSSNDVPLATALNTKYILIMKKYWEADLNAFSGVYTDQDYFGGAPDGGPYQVTITPLSINGSTSYVAITGLWGIDQPPVNVTLNWSNIDTGTTVVPKAPWFVHPTYGQATINPHGTGTFSTTNNTMTIIYEATVAAGSFGVETTVLVK
jgi:hypothetical protein